MPNTVFLFDVDNTLLDNDQIVSDLRGHLDQAFGRASREDYFSIFERLRMELGYADYLGALQRYRAEHPNDAKLLEMSSFLIDYPFAERVYPGALDVVRRCSTLGTTVIVSDGDVVFQPWKVKRSGLWDAFEGRVLIYIHKERMLDDVARRFPAEHYVMVDDKVRLLSAMKTVWRERLTTVFPRQGHYAHDAEAIRRYPSPDLAVDHIADLLAVDWTAILARLPDTRKTIA